MAERLREIAVLAARHLVHILAEKPDMVAETQEFFKIFDSLVQPAYPCQGFGVPEGAKEVGGLLLAKIVLVIVAVNKAVLGTKMFGQHG